jgi:putative transcriptional regulator
MTPCRHPTQAVLSEYASGALRPPFATVVAAHLEYCPRCCGDVARLEAVGFDLLGRLPPTPMAEGRLAQAMAALDGPSPPEQAQAPTRERIEFGPEQIAPGMSIWRAPDGDNGELLYLLRLPAGRQLLLHGHQGAEFTTVLAGAYRDGEEIYATGDFCELDASADHQPCVVAGADCLCMIASEKPMRMDTPEGQRIQDLTGI